MSQRWSNLPADMSEACQNIVMAMASWIEHLKCPRCGKTGEAELFEISPFNNGFRKVPEGFMVVVGEYGSEFYCIACGIPEAS